MKIFSIQIIIITITIISFSGCSSSGNAHRCYGNTINIPECQQYGMQKTTIINSNRSNQNDF